MTQHNSPHAPKRAVFIFDPHAHKGTVKTFFDPRTIALTSDTRLRRAPDWRQHAAEFTPAIGVRTPTGQQPPAAHTWGTAEQCAWWQNISARTAALASIAVVVSAAVAGAAVIARGDLR
ncbi:hypothetical protein [Rhodococcus sp. NPDC006774]|uniref:hypothetical protein n=1 Tax=Rhodococcus sp. NPDC006774 TaxID=3157186 RepID=UPI0033D4EF00